LETAAAVSGDRQQPGPEVALDVEAGQIPQSARKRFLCHIFRILTVAQHAIAEPEDLAAKLVDKFSHGGLIPAQASPDQFENVLWQLHTSAAEPSAFTRDYPAKRGAVSAAARVFRQDCVPKSFFPKCLA
jgi:hypothetical protein